MNTPTPQAPLRPATSLTLATRIAGGLLAIATAEAHATSLHSHPGTRAATRPLLALLDVHTRTGQLQAPPRALADGARASAPAWLLPTAIIHTDRASRRALTEQLARSARLGEDELPACIDYVELAAALLENRSPVAPPSAPVTPPTIARHDAGVAAALARQLLAQGASLRAVLHAPIGFAALVSAAGLIGLRDGFDPVLQCGYTPHEPTWSCLAHTQQLVRAHTNRYPTSGSAVA